MKPIFFASQSALREWFEKNHKTETEVLVGFHKVGTGKPSITWSQSVDEAICFGWIDGIRKSIDENSYTIRFTPRKPTSIWSAVNIKKVEELTRLGLMKPEGIAAFERRDDARSRMYSFEQKNIKLDISFEKKFKANKKAWKYFQSQAPYYQRTATWWVMSAKQEATRLKRLDELIRESEGGQYIKPLRRPGGS
jgi:uncharacterized protein YdeI (YjbR/CyaY-like superfamily)